VAWVGAVVVPSTGHAELRPSREGVCALPGLEAIAPGPTGPHYTVLATASGSSPCIALLDDEVAATDDDSVASDVDAVACDGEGEFAATGGGLDGS
jgi:hypothetical protein